MNRALTLLLTTIVVIGLGCGINSYESRITQTEGAIKEQITRDHHLIPAPTGKFQEFGFFLRPPKPLEPTKTFQLTEPLTPGLYDLDGSFVSPKMNLHFLGRRKLAKKAPSKKPTPADTAQRGPFVQDVQGLLGSVYGGAAQGEVKLAAVEKAPNTYKRQIFPKDETTNVHVYYYNQKDDQATYDAALIWELPATLPKAMGTPIDLTLKSFAVGRRAQRAFSGETTEEEAPSAEGGGAGGTAF